MGRLESNKMGDCYLTHHRHRPHRNTALLVFDRRISDTSLGGIEQPHPPINGLGA